MHDSKTLEWFEKNNLTPPSTTQHDLTPDDIKDRVKPLHPHSWRLEGNRLIAKTDMGELVNFIDTGYILTGEDKNGMPILKRI